MHPLEGPRRKIARARKHLKAFEAESRGFFKRKPYSSIPDFHPDEGRYSFRVRVNRSFQSADFATVVGDCIHNTRSALDHLAWRLSEDYSGVIADDTQTQFPIFKSGAGFARRGATQIARLGPNVKRIVDSLQPYHRPNPTNQPLWSLRELDNADKHRALVLTTSVTQEFSPKVTVPPNREGTWELELFVGRLVDEAILGTVTILPPSPQVQVKGNFTFCIMFDDPLLAFLPVTDVLTELIRLADAIINLFEPAYASGRLDDDALAGVAIE